MNTTNTNAALIETAASKSFECRAGLTLVDNQTGIWIESPRTKRRIEIPAAMFPKLPNRVASRIAHRAAVGRLAVSLTRDELHAVAQVHAERQQAQKPAPAPVAARPANPWTGWRHPRGARRAKAYTAPVKAPVAAPVAFRTPLEALNSALGTSFTSMDQLSHEQRLWIDKDYRVISDGTLVRFYGDNSSTGARTAFGQIIRRDPSDGAYLIQMGSGRKVWIHRLCVEVAPALPTRSEVPQS